MASRKHISRKDISASAFTPRAKPNILQTRAFSNGKHARSSELPKTDILQTRPFATPAQKSSQSEVQPLTPEAREKVETFGYNGVSIPSFAPSTVPPTVQREEVTEEDTSSQSETEEYQPIWGFARELSKPQSEEVSPQSGTIQLKCDECGAENSEEKLPETIQTQAEISPAKDYTQNTFEQIRGGKETEIWQPKSIGKLDTKLLARNQQSELSITQAKPSRIRAKKVSELVGNTETLSKPEVANPALEVATTTEIKELHQPIQAKLTVGEAGDKYEQEADAVAAQVVSKINSPPPQESVQRESELRKSPGNDELMAQLPALPSLIPGAVLGRIGSRVSQKVLWQTFWKVVIKRFGIRGAAAAALSLADGPLPIGELISIGIAIATLWDLFHLWNELWEQAATEAVNKSPAVTPSEEEDDARDKPIPQDEDENSRYLYAFGNKTNPRAPREQKDIPVDREGYVNGQPERGEKWPQGASTFGDPKLAPIKGHYHRIPRNAPIPPLAVMADGRDVGGPHGSTHHTIFPIERMLFLTFSQLFMSLPWIYAGNKK